MRLPTLCQFFRHQLQPSFQARGLGDASTVDYVSDMLARFAHMRAFHALRDDEGRPLEHIVDMLAAWAQAQEPRVGGRASERAVMQHIGEYTLFMSGLFRERVSARGELNYYMTHGRNAFWRSADYEINPARRRTYRALYENFAPISDALDYLRRVQFPLRDTGAPGHLLAAYWRT